VIADGANVPAQQRSSQRGLDAERLRVGKRLPDQRTVDRQRASLIESGPASQLGDGIEEPDEAARYPS